jgi:hypothetical protein
VLLDREREAQAVVGVEVDAGEQHVVGCGAHVEERDEEARQGEAHEGTAPVHRCPTPGIEK